MGTDARKTRSSFFASNALLQRVRFARTSQNLTAFQTDLGFKGLTSVDIINLRGIDYIGPKP